MIRLYSTTTVARALGVEPKWVARRIRGAVGAPLPRYNFGHGKNTVRVDADTFAAVAQDAGRPLTAPLILRAEEPDAPVYPVSEVARLLDASRVWVYKLVERGELENASGPGEPALVPADSLRAFIERHRVEA